MTAKKRSRDVLAGRTAEMQLYRAVRRYVEERGGKVVVIGGIELQEWPGDPTYAFRVAVRVTGNKGAAPEGKDGNDG